MLSEQALLFYKVRDMTFKSEYKNGNQLYT